MQNTTMRAALYLRLSEDREKSGDNVKDQELGGRKVADSLGAEVVAVYNDNDKSAKAPRKRPGFAQMLEDAASGSFDVLIVRDLDRLYRHPMDQEDLVAALSGHSVTVHQERTGHPLDLTSPQGLLVAGMMAQVGIFELRQKERRQRDMNLSRASQGEMRRGPSPYGWNPDRTTVEPQSAAVVREAFKRVLSGEALGAIIRDWNARGIPSPKGGRWAYATLRQTLLRPVNAGLVEYRGAILRDVKAQWEPLVSLDDYYATKAILEAPERRTSSTNRARHLLSGIALCQSCRKPLKSANVGSRGRNMGIYRCTNPDCDAKVSVRREVLNQEVEKRFLAERGEAMTAKIKQTVDTGPLLTKVENQIRSVTAQMAEDDADMVALAERLSELKAERAALGDSKSRVVWSVANAHHEWTKAGEDVGAKRDLLKSHLVSLTVARRGNRSRNTFHADRVVIEWTADPYDSESDLADKRDRAWN